MIRNTVRTTCALALLLSFIFASTLTAAEPASSKGAATTPAFHPWGSFNAGSWVEIKSTSVTKTAGKEVTNIIGTKITLLEKSSEKAVLENEMTAQGQTTKTKFDQPLTGYSEALPEDVTVLKTGSETLTIAGKSVTCETLEASMNVGGTKVLFKRWTSRQVPGWMVKMDTSSNGSHGTTDTIDFKAY